MILDLDRTTLEMVRGDSYTLPIVLNCGSREKFVAHTLQNNECLYIGIMKPNQSFENAEIRCMLNKDSEKDVYGNSIMRLLPEHTVNLIPGKYYLTVKFSNGRDITTLVDGKLFFITGSMPPIDMR
jgi:hypothetical protein